MQKNFLSRAAAGLVRRPRMIWGLGNSAINFVIVAGISAMPQESLVSLNLASLYIVFLFWDACFLTINDATGPSELKIGGGTVLGVGMLGIAAYSVISGDYKNLTLFPVALAAAWAKSQHNLIVARYNYSQDGRRVTGIQASVLAATMVAIGMGLATANALIFAVAAFVVAPLAALPLGGIARHQMFIRRDFTLMPAIFLDFLKNQIVFVLFGKVIEPAALADILFARSILSPIALGMAVRRKGIEDEFLIRESGRPYLGKETLSMYAALVLVGFAGLFVKGAPMLTVAGAWVMVVVLQDFRAHFLRLSLFRRQLSSHIFAFSSLFTIGMFAAASLRIQEFAPWILLFPYLLEISILALIVQALKLRSR